MQQGCSLPPLLLLYITEGLSIIIHSARREGVIKGIKVTKLIRITHLLFLDDVILFGEGTKKEWQAYKAIMDIFCKATSMLISESKSTILVNELEEGDIGRIRALFPFDIKDLNSGIKYLG